MREKDEGSAGDESGPRRAGSPNVSAALRSFLELYGKGEYWESHEALEGPWRETGSDFLQGLILYASAWVHWKRENAHGVVAQLRKTLERLEGWPPEHMGIDVKMIRAHCREVPGIVRTREDWPVAIAPLEVSRLCVSPSTPGTSSGRDRSR